MKNAGKACNNRLYRHIRTFEKIVKNYFVISAKLYIFKRRYAIIIININVRMQNFRNEKASTEITNMKNGRRAFCDRRD